MRFDYQYSSTFRLISAVSVLVIYFVYHGFVFHFIRCDSAKNKLRYELNGVDGWGTLRLGLICCQARYIWP